jgi:hypothetical protein
MVFWIKKISWGKVILTAVIFTVISFIIHQIEALLTIKYYMMPQYFGVWSKLMMPSAGPPSAAFTITSLVFSFVTGISVALIYYYLRDRLPPIGFKRAFYFADVLVATSFVFSTLPMYLMFNVPVALLVSWFISNFIILTLGSWVMVKIIK